MDNILNKQKLICLRAINWFQEVLSNINNSF